MGCFCSIDTSVKDKIPDTKIENEIVHENKIENTIKVEVQKPQNQIKKKISFEKLNSSICSKNKNMSYDFYVACPLNLKMEKLMSIAQKNEKKFEKNEAEKYKMNLEYINNALEDKDININEYKFFIINAFNNKKEKTKKNIENLTRSIGDTNLTKSFEERINNFESNKINGRNNSEFESSGTLCNLGKSYVKND